MLPITETQQILIAKDSYLENDPFRLGSHLKGGNV
jgi:hypothetical protein